MKKICFIVDSIFSVGGVQRVTAVIAKELAKEYDVTIVTFDNQEDKNITLYGLHEADIHYRFFSYPKIGFVKNLCCKLYSGFYLKCKPQSKWASDLYSYSSFPSEFRNALIEELKLGGYDIIIGVHAPLAARLATIRPHLKEVKLIGWLHNSYQALFGEDSMYLGKKRKRHYIYQFRKLDQVIVLSKNDAELFYQYDSHFSPIVIYNPLTLRPGHLSTGNSKHFLAVGRFTPLHKGIDLLISAFHLFAHNNKEWELDIVGEGPEGDYYQSLIDKYHLGDRVHIHPFTNYIQSYYSKAQIFVLSSRWEGFGLVMVEAMAHGLPVISSDLPSSKEILGDFGIFFKNGDIQNLSKKLEKATTIDWQKKSQEAIEMAQRFEVSSIIQQWKDLMGD